MCQRVEKMNFTVFLQEEVVKKDYVTPIEGVKFVFFKARGVRNWREIVDGLVCEISGTPVVFCSIQVAKYIQKHVLKLSGGLIISNHSPEPQIGMATIFDWNQYSTHVPDDLLFNRFGQIYRFGDLDKPETDLPNEMFVRPVSGWKPFAGFSCPKEFIKSETNALNQLEHVPSHELVVVFPQKKIYNEWRYWIVDSQISTSSSYGWDNDHHFKKPSSKVDEFVETVIPYFDNIGVTDFVMDVAEGEEGYRLLELNALSTSGWYDAMDEEKLIKDLTNIFC